MKQLAYMYYEATVRKSLNIAAKNLAILLSIREVLGSNLVPESYRSMLHSLSY